MLGLFALYDNELTLILDIPAAFRYACREAAVGAARQSG